MVSEDVNDCAPGVMRPMSIYAGQSGRTRNTFVPAGRHLMALPMARPGHMIRYIAAVGALFMSQDKRAAVARREERRCSRGHGNRSRPSAGCQRADIALDDNSSMVLGQVAPESNKARLKASPLMRRQAYSLHILRHDPPSRACTIALSKLPGRANSGGAMPLANFPSAKQLASALSRVGVRTAVLEKIAKGLDADGLHTLRNLKLSDEQVATLGFKRIA